MKYHFKYKKAKEGGYWAQCVEISGCITQGDTMDELQVNMEDALNTMLDEPGESKLVFELPHAIVRGRNILKVAVRPNVAFAFLLRQVRLRAGVTQTKAAKMLGFKNIYSYQRLESARNTNPRLDLIVRVKAVFPDFDLEMIVSDARHDRAG
ncbi:MAG: type II toxin-antitoxin system HicB family antitoxin [Proteobacteria bacterium]|nr:type II toxin-antitoxin system HicB family antitoxin [Pseudomonadota bacterium]